MAQKTEKEETEFKVPETTLSSCITTTTTATSSTASSSSSPPSPPSTAASAAAAASPLPDLPETAAKQAEASKAARSGGQEAEEEKSRSRSDVEVAEEEGRRRRREIKRCSGCKRKVGLTGFRCRCGELFCSEHRYSDRHDCSFDYKAAGREAIARENPVVKAAKILKV